MSTVDAAQFRAAQLFETEVLNRRGGELDAQASTSEALVKVLKQACSRNKASEKRQLWQQKHRDDHGSASSISLKTRDGEVHNIPKIPKGAQVTDNSVNKYDQDRLRNSESKEDKQLERFCDGRDSAWRPEKYFTEQCREWAQDELPPWPIRPNEIFTNPHISMRIMAHRTEQKRQKKEEKAAKKEASRAAKKAKKSKDKEKPCKKEKKKHGKKEKSGKKKEKGKRRKMEHKDKRDTETSESDDEDTSS